MYASLTGIFTALAVFPATAFAEAQYKLLAPLGPLPPVVTMATYLEGIIQVIIGVAGVLAVVMIVICGVQMIGSPSVSQKSASKECIWNAILGLMLAAGSWLILNTINTQLLSTTAGLIALPQTAIIQQNAKDSPMPTAKGFYFEYKDVKTNAVRYQKYATMAECEEMRTTFQGDSTLVTVSSTCFEVKAGVAGAKDVASPPQPRAAGDAMCVQAGLNLCEGKYRQCWNANCEQFKPLVGGKAVDGKLIMAIIMEETSCGQTLVGDGGKSCGPMQIQLDKANKYRDKCGLDEKVPVTCGWLANKANWDKAICLSAQHLKSLEAPCPGGVQKVAAGYNGGSGVCTQPSANCNGLASCSGGQMKIWECPYTDNAHQQCDAGYFSTRNYATEVLYCTQKPGSNGY